MAYDICVAARIKTALGGLKVVERRMIGGLCYMLSGNLLCGTHGSDLLLQVAREQTGALLKRTGGKPFVMRGRALSGWMLVDQSAITADADLRAWLKIAIDHVSALPAKAIKPVASAPNKNLPAKGSRTKPAR